MPALGAGIHVLVARKKKTWMRGTSPRMTAVSRRAYCEFSATLSAGVAARAKSPLR
jgi:hypothetical protein